jgi:hypothetical protein
LERPPNVLSFDHRPTKKPRANSKNTIEIHNHISQADRTLTDQGGQHRINMPSASPPPLSQSHSATDNEPDFLVAYPPIGDALRELHSVMPAANMPQYEIGLQQYGVYYVDGAEGLDTRFLQDEVGMPPGVIGAFQEHIRRLLRKAKKGKGRELVYVKAEGEDENDPIYVK